MPDPSFFYGRAKIRNAIKFSSSYSVTTFSFINRQVLARTASVLHLVGGQFLKSLGRVFCTGCTNHYINKFTFFSQLLDYTYDIFLYFAGFRVPAYIE